MKTFFIRRMTIQKGSGKSVNNKSGSTCCINLKLPEKMSINKKSTHHFYNMLVFPLRDSILFKVLGQDVRK